MRNPLFAAHKLARPHRLVAWSGCLVSALLIAALPARAQPQADLDGSAATAVATAVNGDQLGDSVAILGDVNGDGLADFLVGAPAAGAASRAYVIFGRAGGLPVDIAPSALNGSNGFAIQADLPVSALGQAATALGDINGDGCPDFALSAPFATVSPSATVHWYLAGKVYVVFGRPQGLPFPAVLHLDTLDGSNGFMINSPGSNWNFGHSLAAAGDFDGDGLDDLLIGSWRDGVADRVWLVRGSTQPFAAVYSPGDLVAAGAAFELQGTVGTDFGRAVAGIGDVNGDGKADIAIGAPAMPASNRAGRVYLLLGRSAGGSNVIDLDDTATPGVTKLDGSGAGNFVGAAVAGIGDVNGDAVPDLLVGAPGRNQYVGAAYVVFGGNPVSQTLDALVASGGAVRLLDNSAGNANDMVGAAVAGGQDLDGDGTPDLVVGVPGGFVVGGRRGAVFVVPGRTSGDPAWPAEIDLDTLLDGQIWQGVALSDSSDTGRMLDWLSLSVGADVNGDGKPDLLIGSTVAEATDPVIGPWQGKAWLPIGPIYDDTIFRDGFESPASP